MFADSGPASGVLAKLSPLLIPFVVLFAGGVVLSVGQSFGFWLPVAVEGDVGSAYAVLLDPHVQSAFGFSIYVAFVSAFLSVWFGALFAYGIWRLPRRWQQVGVASKVGLILPHIAVAFVVLVLWSKSGLISSLLFHLGIIREMADFPEILYAGHGVGMILAYTFKEMPFTMILCLAMLQSLDPGLVETAHMLGAGRWRVFRRIIVPHVKPALHTAFIILFLYSFGAFDIPYLLSASSPGMLSIEVFNLYFNRELTDRPQVMAILVVMLLVSLGFVVAYTKIAARLSGRERKL